MLPATIRAVFFDAVGTVLFPHESIATTYRRMAAQHGIVLDDVGVRARLREGYLRQEQFDRDRDWRTDEQREEDRWRSVVFDVLQVSEGEACFQDLWHYYSEPTAWQVHPEIAEVLKALHERGLILGLASNFDARLRALVDYFPELALLRDRCLISSIVGHRKPGQGFFAEVQRQADCRPEQIAFIGDDRVNDYDGAITAGMFPVLLSPEPRADLRAVQNMRELLGER